MALPCGLAIFDDRVAIGVYDDGTGMLDAFVDTDDDAVRSWAIDCFGEYRDASIGLDE